MNLWPCGNAFLLVTRHARATIGNALSPLDTRGLLNQVCAGTATDANGPAGGVCTRVATLAMFQLRPLRCVVIAVALQMQRRPASI